MSEPDLHSEIVATTSALLVVLDPAGRILLFNPACERASGYRFEEVRGRLLSESLLAPEQREPFARALERLRAGEALSGLRTRWRARSGATRLIEWSAAPVADSARAAARIHFTGAELSGERDIEELRQRALLDAIPDAVWLTDSGGRYIQVNRRFWERWGLDPGGALGKTAFEIFPADIAEDNAAEDREIVRTGRPVRAEKRRFARGREYWVDVIKVPVTDESGRVVGIAGISRDITERKFAEARRLARDAGLRECLVREVHHRIKNHLQGAVTLIQELAARHPESAPVLEAAGARLDSIASVHGLLGITGEREPRLEQLLIGLVSGLKNLKAELPVRLSLRTPASARVREAELVPLALIVNELIMNAVKHSRGADDGRPVEVALEEAGEVARIRVVSRSGRLPPRFDFETASGLGGGLALVKSLLPPQGAQLRIENLPDAAGVEALLTLSPPVILPGARPAPLRTAATESAFGAHFDR